MKRKLEFPLFYLVWVATVGELVFSVGKDNMLKIVITGVLALASTLMFVRVNSGTDDFIGALLKPVLVCMAVAIIVSTVVSRNPLMLCVLGPELLPTAKRLLVRLRLSTEQDKNYMLIPTE